jgi:hypothetical protein
MRSSRNINANDRKIILENEVTIQHWLITPPVRLFLRGGTKWIPFDSNGMATGFCYYDLLQALLQLCYHTNTNIAGLTPLVIG